MRKPLIIALLAVLSISCAKEKNVPKNFDYGHVENNVYVNDYFGINMPLNKDWKVQSKEQMDKINEAGIKIVSGDDNKLKRALDASSVNVAQLFMSYKQEVGTNTEFNPSLLLNAENLVQFPEVTNAQAYIVQAKKLMDNTAMNIDYKRDPYEVTIGGKTFVCLEIFNRDYNIHQDYYAIILNGFAVGIIASYETDEDKMALKSMIDGIKID